MKFWKTEVFMYMSSQYFWSFWKNVKSNSMFYFLNSLLIVIMKTPSWFKYIVIFIMSLMKLDLEIPRPLPLCQKALHNKVVMIIIK